MHLSHIQHLKNTPAEIIAIIIIMDVIFQLEKNIMCFIRMCHCINPWTFSFRKYEDTDMMLLFLFCVIIGTDFKMEAN